MSVAKQTESDTTECCSPVGSSHAILASPPRTPRCTVRWKEKNSNAVFGTQRWLVSFLNHMRKPACQCVEGRLINLHSWEHFGSGPPFKIQPSISGGAICREVAHKIRFITTQMLQGEPDSCSHINRLLLKHHSYDNISRQTPQQITGSVAFKRRVL